MGRSTTSPDQGSGSPRRLTIGFLMSVMAVCAKHASRVSNKLKAKPGLMIKTRHNKPDSNHKKSTTTTTTSSSPRSAPPKSPLRARPKQLITNISNKAITFMHNKKKPEDKDEDCFVGPHDEFGDGGVWQRAILMGDKCQPLDFSGAIYYDSTGKQLDEVPLRSPRASPLPGYLARRGDL